MSSGIILMILTGLSLQLLELPNGLDVIIGEDHSSPVVTICVTVRTGATCETAETNGLAHFYEHMFFKGNGALPDQTAYNRRMRELGMIRNGVTSSEVVKYYLTVSSDLFEEGMRFMYDAISTPLFDPEEIARERAVILNEYNRNTSSPLWSFWRAQEEVLSREPWRSSAIGVPAVILAADRETMLEFQHAYYTPDNSALIITGDVEPAVAHSAAGEIFGPWQYGGRSNYDSLGLNISIDKDTLVSVGGPVGTGMIRVVYEGPSMAGEQYWTHAADVWGQYMDRMTGEFQTDLVTNGPFTSVYASYYSQRFEPVITFGGTIDPSRIHEGLELLRGEIDEMFREGYFTPGGIGTAVEQLRRTRLFSQESSREMATETLPFWWVQGGGLDYYLDYPDNLTAVTPEDVQVFLAQWVQGRPSAVFLLTPGGEWRE